MVAGQGILDVFDGVALIYTVRTSPLVSTAPSPKPPSCALIVYVKLKSENAVTCTEYYIRGDPRGRVVSRRGASQVSAARAAVCAKLERTWVEYLRGDRVHGQRVFNDVHPYQSILCFEHPRRPSPRRKGLPQSENAKQSHKWQRPFYTKCNVIRTLPWN